MDKKTTMKEARLAKGITQEQLVLETGICYSSIVAYDNQYRMPMVDKAIKIAQALGVAAEDINWEVNKK